MKITKLALIFAAVAVFLIAACNQTSPVANKPATPASTAPAAAATTAQTTAPANDAAATDGKELYSTKCQICHKDTGKGGKVTVEGKDLKPADLTSAKMASRADDKLAEMVSEGSPEDGMPAFKSKLSAEQIKAVVQYVITLQKAGQ
jgi:cytochrome c6